MQTPVEAMHRDDAVRGDVMQVTRPPTLPRRQSSGWPVCAPVHSPRRRTLRTALAEHHPRTRETPVPRCGRARRLLCTFAHMPTPSPTRLRRARGAVSVLFLTNGALMANLLPRYPEIKAELGLANSTYGLVLAAFPAGAILAGLGAATLIRRFGSAPVAVATTMLTAAGLLGAGWAPTALLLAPVLLLAGAADAVTDVAQNAHGLRVQRAY